MLPLPWTLWSPRLKCLSSGCLPLGKSSPAGHPAAALGPKPLKCALKFSLVSGGFGTDLASVPGSGFLTKMGGVHHTSLPLLSPFLKTRYGRATQK